ncbi:MAG: PEGA domain-containing protein [Kofleriaceae bacterium]
MPVSSSPGVLVVALLVVAALLGGHAGRAHAAEAAETAFAEAQDHYVAGRYEQAAAAFQRAHAARPLALFHFNTAACFQMKAKAGGAGTADALAQAIDYHGRYLAEDPAAADRAQIEATVGVLQTELAARAAATPPAQPSAAVVALGDVATRGVVVIESNPSTANIYLDDVAAGVFARTPWSGQLPAGEHTAILEARGYVSKRITVAPAKDKLVVYSADLEVEQSLGMLAVTANVAGARVYLDDKGRGVVGVTPYQHEVPPGRHTVIVAADGYDDYQETIEVVAGRAVTIDARLEGGAVGYLTVSGDGIQRATVYVDGELACERGPCRKGVRPGSHEVRVTRPGAKPYQRRLEIQENVETTVKVAFAPTPGRGDAIVTYVLSAVLAGGGVGLYLYGSGLQQDIDDETAAGTPPADDDPRRNRAKYTRYGAYGAWGIAGVTLLTAIYYTFRDKGPPSAARVDNQAVARRGILRDLELRPEAAPGYGGVALALTW